MAELVSNTGLVIPLAPGTGRIANLLTLSSSLSPPDYHRASANLSKRSGIGAV